jgi:hypothetical protein
MLGKKNVNDLIGEEKFLFINEDKSYSSNERYDLFKEMSKLQPKTWKKSHHLQRIFGDIFIVNFNIFILFKLYYHVCDPMQTIYNNFLKSTKLKVSILFMGIFDLAYINYSYKIFPREIYDECYSNLSDKEFVQLYNYVTNPNLNYFKTV